METPYLNEMIQELEGYTGANNSYLSKQGIKKLNELKAIKEQLLSNRRGLLIDFFRKTSKVRLEDEGNMYTVTKAVDDYLKVN